MTTDTQQPSTDAAKLLLDIRNATHHVAQAMHLLLDAIYESDENQTAMIEGAEQSCIRAQAVINTLLKSLPTK